MFPKTLWNYSLQTEAERIAFTATQTVKLFYHQNGFLVLPHCISGNGNCVYLPELNFRSNFFSQLKKIKKFTIAHPDIEAVKEVKPLLKKNNLNFNELKNNWNKKEKKFWPIFFDLFPQLKSQIKILEIRPTAYGTLSSFTPLGAIKDSLIIYWRQDALVNEIAATLLSAAFYNDLSTEDYSWQEKMAITSFLMTKTKLAEVFPENKSTFHWLKKKENGQLKQESQLYLKKLNIIYENIFKVDKENIFLENTRIDQKLTLKERAILMLLITNRNQLCNYDQLAEVLWKTNTDRFSPWAIAKIIERLRNKLESFGLSPTVIQTKRKEGYILVD